MRLITNLFPSLLPCSSPPTINHHYCLPHPIDFGVSCDSDEHITVVFTVFVMCQMFNEINARSISNVGNVFNGIFFNFFFVGVLVITGALQYALVEYPSVSWLVRAAPMPGGLAGWYKCILLSGLTIPVGAFMRWVPVIDNTDDIAIPSQIIADLVYSSSNNSGNDASNIDTADTTTNSSSNRKVTSSNIRESMSQTLWFTFCITVILYCGVEFGHRWLAHMEAYSLNGAGEIGSIFSKLVGLSVHPLRVIGNAVGWGMQVLHLI